MSCGTRVQDFHPGDPDGAWLLRSSLLINYSENANCWYRKLLVASNSATEVLLTDFTAGTANLHLRVLPVRVLLMAAPDHCGPPGPVVSPVAVLQPLWLRNSTTAPSYELQLLHYCPAVHVCRASLDLGYGRNLTTLQPNVYSGQHRFSRAGRRGSPPRPVHGWFRQLRGSVRCSQ